MGGGVDRAGKAGEVGHAFKKSMYLHEMPRAKSAVGRGLVIFSFLEIPSR